MKRPIVSWPTLIEEHRQSGLSQKNFCDQRGLALSTFTYWKRKTRESASIELRRPQFIELDLRPAVPTRENYEDLVVELPHGVVMRFRGIAR